VEAVWPEEQRVGIEGLGESLSFGFDIGIAVDKIYSGVFRVEVPYSGGGRGDPGACAGTIDGFPEQVKRCHGRR
jgi:hypothetical protein